MTVGATVSMTNGFVVADELLPAPSVATIVIVWVPSARALEVNGLEHAASVPVSTRHWVVVGEPVIVNTTLGVVSLEIAAGSELIVMTGAVVSHVMSGDSVARFVAPLVFPLCAVASWALRPQSRTLGTLGSLEDILPKRVRA